MSQVKAKKKRWVAVLLNVFVPGLGQLYVGSFLLGFSLFFTQLGIFGLLVENKGAAFPFGAFFTFLSYTSFVLYIFSLVHAANKAD